MIVTLLGVNSLAIQGFLRLVFRVVIKLYYLPDFCCHKRYRILTFTRQRDSIYNVMKKIQKNAIIIVRFQGVFSCNR